MTTKTPKPNTPQPDPEDHPAVNAYLAFVGRWFVAFALVAVLAVAGAFLLPMASEYGRSLIAIPKPPETQPGELVDRAMAIPGAIVISPHGDLVELGLVKRATTLDGDPVPLYLQSPAIAVHAKKHWCVWELGMVNKNYFCHLPFRSSEEDEECSKHRVEIRNLYENGSYDGYQSAYDSFKRCVDEGNSPPKYDESILHVNSGACPKNTHWTKADTQDTDPTGFVMCEDGKPDPLKPMSGK